MTTALTRWSTAAALALMEAPTDRPQRMMLELSTDGSLDTNVTMSARVFISQLVVRSARRHEVGSYLPDRSSAICSGSMRFRGLPELAPTLRAS